MNKDIQAGGSALVALSGGVDSAVAAFTLIEAGCHVEACYLYMLPDGLSDPGLKASQKICRRLDIKLHVIEARHLFNNEVISYFVSTYSAGLTPNPCVICNPRLKLKQCLDLAGSLGMDFLATGHYARIKPHSSGSPALYSALYPEKDQSYFLHQLPASFLPRLSFPLGNLNRQQVTRIASDAGLDEIVLEESQEVCFLKGNYRSFLEKYECCNHGPGPIKNLEGETIGRHSGLYAYTIGQRRGLGIPDATPYYVLDLDVRENTLVVGKDSQLLRETLYASGLNLFFREKLAYGLTCHVKIRSRHHPAPATVRLVSDDLMEVVFSRPQRAITPGQFAVFYRDDMVIGGGQICK